MSSGKSTPEKSEDPGYAGTGVKMRLVRLDDVFAKMGFSHGLDNFCLQVSASIFRCDILVLACNVPSSVV